MANDVRATLNALDRAKTFDAAQDALRAFARATELPVLAWSPDVSRPGFDAAMDSFMRRQGWPDEVMTLWWNRNVMLKSPLYIRCRFKMAPFLTVVASETADIGGDAQKIEAAMIEMGLRMMLTVPVHLPRGQVSMITWAGDKSPEKAADILTRHKTEFLAAAHYFTQAYRNEAGLGGISEENLSSLTPREWECLRLTAQGYREAELAELINLSTTTVRFHLNNVMRKLGATTRTQAVAIAAQLGLLGPIGS